VWGGLRFCKPLGCFGSFRKLHLQKHDAFAPPEAWRRGNTKCFPPHSADSQCFLEQSRPLANPFLGMFSRGGLARENTSLSARPGRGRANRPCSDGESASGRVGSGGGEFARRNPMDLRRSRRIPRACRLDRSSVGRGGAGPGGRGPRKHVVFVPRGAWRRGKTIFLDWKTLFSRGVAHSVSGGAAGRGSERGGGVGR